MKGKIKCIQQPNEKYDEEQDGNTNKYKYKVFATQNTLDVNIGQILLEGRVSELIRQKIDVEIIGE